MESLINLLVVCLNRQVFDGLMSGTRYSDLIDIFHASFPDGIYFVNVFENPL